MKTILCIFTLLLLIPVSILAQENDRPELTGQLAEALGFEKMLASFKQQGQTAADAQILQMVEQVKKSMPGMPPKYMTEVRDGARDYLNTVATSWSESEATRIYFTGLTAALSTEEMRSAIKHYQSEQGKKELKAIEAASQAMATYIINSQQEASQMAMQTFVARIKTAAVKAQQERVTASSSGGAPQTQLVPSTNATKGQ